MVVTLPPTSKSHDEAGKAVGVGGPVVDLWQLPRWQLASIGTLGLGAAQASRAWSVVQSPQGRFDP
jgi:hypothetical protein